jgi:hypothetical protein
MPTVLMPELLVLKSLHKEVIREKGYWGILETPLSCNS